MNGKKSPIIFAVLIIMLVVLIIVAVVILTKKPQSPVTPDKPTDLAVPEIELSIDTTEPEQDKVVITCKATIDDEEGVATITLPDGTPVNGDSKDYTVTRNADYTFKATGYNGQSATKTITIKNIRALSAYNPYIPEGFTHIGGEVDTGFVIEDRSGNQFVWIPVRRGLLTRNTSLNADFEDSSASASELVNSVAKYYGFYIGRFEASQYDLNGTFVAASKADQNPWTNVSFVEAQQLAIDMAIAFGYEKGISTNLINSYAWDTALEWIDSVKTNFSSGTNYGNYSGSIARTGQTPSDIVQNICDLAGNVREWTTEIDKSTATLSDEERKQNVEIIKRVVRGGSAILSRTANSHIGYNQETGDSYWGFRTILYK